MTKPLLYLKLIFWISCFSVFSQSPDNEIFIQPSVLSEADSHKIFFRVENLNLFKNTEYFGKIAEGHTYLGYILRPSFSYQPTSNTVIQAGMHLLKYSGINGFSQTLPFFRFQYRITPKLDLIMGNLYSALNHRMIEPMYGFDRYLEENLESGIQFLYRSDRYKGDLWLNWQKFIGFVDPNKEQFSVGHTSEILLTNPDNPLKLTLPVQFLAAHKGGQNTLDTSNMITRVNISSGLSAQYRFDHSFVKSIGAYGFYLVYKDISPMPHIDFSQGNGTYANMYFNTSWVNVTVGHWTGYRFFNPRGERIFSNISTVGDIERLAVPPRYAVENRSLILSKVFIHHEIYTGINLAAAFESYYDYKENRYDLYYALYILCNLKFFMHKINYLN